MGKIIDLRKYVIGKMGIEDKIRDIQNLDFGKRLIATGTYNENGADERLRKRIEKLKTGLRKTGTDVSQYHFEIGLLGEFKVVYVEKEK
jgi:hypothetical protein